MSDRAALMAEIADAAACLDGAEPATERSVALDVVAAAFGLSGFERRILALAAGVELSGEVRTKVSRLTFSLALERLPDPHWSALTPESPLRRWRLVVLETGRSLTDAEVRIDETVLHYLAGAPLLDPRLDEVLNSLPPGSSVPSQARPLAEIAAAWNETNGLVRLTGSDEAGRRALFALAAERLGLRPFLLSAEAVPAAPAERETLARLLERDAALLGLAVLLEAPDPAGLPQLERFADRLRIPLALSGEAARAKLTRNGPSVEVRRSTPPERRSLWREALGEERSASLNGQVERLAAQFDLDAGEIQVAARADDLWQACLASSRPGLEALAERVVSAAHWDDLVLPPRAKSLLQSLVAQVRHRHRVMEEWGMARGSERGLGTTALFAGPSGTGKTLAAEVVANELKLDLYRIDLSQVVNKYIGETEKNLARVFDAAEAGGAVLLFDEADSLFGKRTEVKDSHDRYANLEVGYLLQRMEAYRGLAILTTNLKETIDPAFLRRLRFVVNFPFPDATGRAEIWRRAFPTTTPTEGLVPERLAQLSIAGGAIRSIALNAAFLAADRGEPVQAAHVQRAAGDEYAKHDRLLSSAETEGWA